MYYLAIFIILCAFGLFEQTDIAPKRKTVMYIASFLMLMLTAGLRYETGGDWTSYTDIFNTIEPVDRVLAGDNYFFEWMGGLEIGYRYLNSIVKFIVPNVQLLFFIVALIISSFVFKGIKQYAPYPIMGVLIYFGILFFSLDMIVLRQGLAVAIVFWGYKYIENKQFLKFVLVCAAASLFHVSALVCIPIYFIARYRYPTWVLAAANIVFIAVLVLNIKWMGDIATNILMSQADLDQDVANKVVAYTTREEYSSSRGLTFGLLANIAVLVILLFRRESLEKSKYFNMFLTLFTIYMFVYCCMSEFVEFGNRLKYYFMISLVILIPQIVASFDRHKLRIIGYVGACMFSLLYCRNIVFENPSTIAFHPYQNYIMYEMYQYKSNGRERLDKSDEEFSKERNQ